MTDQSLIQFKTKGAVLSDFLSMNKTTFPSTRHFFWMSVCNLVFLAHSNNIIRFPTLHLARSVRISCFLFFGSFLSFYFCYVMNCLSCGGCFFLACCYSDYIPLLDYSFRLSNFSSYCL